MSTRLVNVFIVNVRYTTGLGWGCSGVYASEGAIHRIYEEAPRDKPLDANKVKPLKSPPKKPARKGARP